MYKYERLYVQDSPIGYMSTRSYKVSTNKLLIIHKNKPVKLECMKIYEDKYSHILKDILQ